MSTLNAKANAAYNDLIAKTERENPGDVWAGFEHERDAFETGFEAGYKAAQPVVDREAIARAMHNDERMHEWRGSWRGGSCSEVCREGYGRRADPVLALLNGGAS